MSAIDELEEHINMRQVSLQEALNQYDLVGANHDPHNGSYVVLAERDPKMGEGVATRELGYAAPSPFTSWLRSERVPELEGKRGLRTYYDMKRADGTVRGVLRLLKTPVMAARWFVEPASDSTADKNIAKFIEDNLFKELTVPWSRVVEDALLMCEYGFFPFELVFKRDGGKIKLSKLGPRHPLDISDWIWDENGGPRGIVMDGAPGVVTGNQSLFWNTSPAGYNTSPMFFPGDNNFQGIKYGDEPVFIPIEKLIVFVLEQEAGDLRGISILRSAYKHYYYKDTLYKIDAIQKERHGIGVPIIKLPVGFSKQDRDLADDLGRNLRTNERAHIVVPSNWEIMFAKLEGQPVDCLKTIEHHDKKIQSNILAPFMDTSNTGSAVEPFDIFYKSARYIANTICDTFNHFLIPKMVDFNFSRGGYPRLRVRRIGEWDDVRTMSFAFRNFVGANAIIPDETLEKYLRIELDLPAPDPATARTLPNNGQQGQAPDAQPADPNSGSGTGGTAPTGTDVNTPHPPQPPEVGLPRQAKRANVATPAANKGRDGSG